MRNTAETVRELLKVHAGDDDLVLEWTSGANDTPTAEGWPAELKVKTLEGVHLVSILAFEDGFNTVLAALDLDEESFKERWSRDYSAKRLRVRRKGDTFDLCNIS